MCLLSVIPYSRLPGRIRPLLILSPVCLMFVSSFFAKGLQSFHLQIALSYDKDNRKKNLKLAYWVL